MIAQQVVQHTGLAHAKPATALRAGPLPAQEVVAGRLHRRDVLLVVLANACPEQRRRVEGDLAVLHLAHQPIVAIVGEGAPSQAKAVVWPSTVTPLRRLAAS